MTDHLADNGDTLAHVVEQLVIAEHARSGHGPQWGDSRRPIENCPIVVCVKWRAYLRSRLP